MAKLFKGEKFPDFTVDTHLEKDIKISEIAGGKPLCLHVIRYIGCRICRYDVHQIAMNYQKYVDAGIEVAIVMQSTPESIHEDLRKTDFKLPYRIICDPEMKIYKELEILPAQSKERMAGDDGEKLKAKVARATELGIVHGAYEGIEEQLPAFFYIDTDMTARVAYYSKTVVDVPSVDEMIAISKAEKWFR